MEETQTPLISLDLKQNGGAVVLFSFQDIEIWARKEKDFWEWLSKCGKLDGNLSSVWNQQSSVWREVLSQCQKAASAPDGDRGHIIELIKNRIKDGYSSLRSLHSSNTAAIFILSEFKDTPDLAAYALNYFLKVKDYHIQPDPDRQSRITLSYVKAMLFEKGMTGVSDTERASLDSLRHEFSDIIAELRSDLADAKKASLQERGYVKAQSDVFTKQEQDQKNSFETLIKESEAKLEQLTELYNKHMALRAPVSYWTDKGNKHRKLAKAFTGLFLASLAAFVLAMSIEITIFLWNMKPDQKPEAWMLGLLAVSALVGIWGLRIISRVLFSHIHLERDASERITMIETYLSLLREEKLADNEKQLILQTIFRPGATGIVKDDAMPASLWEMCTRMGSPKQ